MTTKSGEKSANDNRANSLNLQTPEGKAAAANHARQVAENRKK